MKRNRFVVFIGESSWWSGIFGGALVPLVIGWIGDQTGLCYAMFFLFLTLGYILAIPYWARPLIDNKTIKNIGVVNN